MFEGLGLALHRLLLRLWPGEKGRRRGERAHQMLRELLGQACGAAARRRMLGRALLDAVRTLARAWGDEAAGWIGTTTRTGRRAMPEMGRSLRIGLRAVSRTPVYAATVIGTLALAIGANSALLSLTHSILLGGLPYADAERVVSVRGGGATHSGERFVLGPEVADNPWIDTAAIYIPEGAANLAVGTGARRVRLTQVSAGFFETLGVEMLLGPGFLRGEDDPRRVVLAHGLWNEVLGGDRGVVGSTVDLAGRAHEVVGVAPPGVDYPSGTEVWIPTPLDFEYYGSAAGPGVVARLTDARQRAAADAFLADRTAERRRATDDLRATAPSLVPLREVLVGSLRSPLVALLGAGALLLVLGCLNLTGLAVTRLADRREELAVRRALGASRGRLTGQLLGEGLALAGLAGVASLAVAALTARAMRLWLPAETPGLPDRALPLSVLLFAGILTLVAGFAVALLPAIRAGRARPPAVAGRATLDPSRARLRTALVVAQIAVALVPAVGAGLLARSLGRLHDVPLGFDTDSVLTFTVALPTATYPDAGARTAYIDGVLDGLEGLPGVVAVGAANHLPLGEGLGAGFGVRAAEDVEGDGVSSQYVQITPGFFAALGTPVLRGSPDRMAEGGEESVVVGAALARELFGTTDVLGRRVRIRVREWSEPRAVSAVVADVRLDGTGGDTREILYDRLSGDGWSTTLGFVVRTSRAPADLAAGVRTVLGEVDPSVPPYNVRTTRQAVSRQLASRRAVAWAGGLLATLALVLAAMGVYGVVAQGVARRRRELGIRIALGAAPRALLRSVLARALLLVTGGLAVGIPLALFVVRGLEGMLYEVDTGDPSTLLAAAGVFALAALGATWIPARRVTRIDPRESLAAE